MTTTNIEQFAAGLDAAIQAHMEWSRRVLRCVVLRTSPGDDMLKDRAHTLCHFGRWFALNRAPFEELDKERTQSMEAIHQAMHDAIRAICSCVLEGKTAKAADLDVFETMQHKFIEHLSYFKTLAITRRAQIDALTGLPLRHRMEQDFALLTRLRQHHDSLQVMLIDVDHFKVINDQHGHAGGDQVLRQLVVALRRTLRDGDLIYRYGGDEFLALMKSSAPEVAAKRALEAVRALSVRLPTKKIVHPTVTIGVAPYAEGESLTKMIRSADAALYTAKSLGRNCYAVPPEAKLINQRIAAR
jgi:diguanylate cyclase (GGDEF)-like protein